MAQLRYGALHYRVHDDVMCNIAGYGFYGILVLYRYLSLVELKCIISQQISIR